MGRHLKRAFQLVDLKKIFFFLPEQLGWGENRRCQVWPFCFTGKLMGSDLETPGIYVVPLGWGGCEQRAESGAPTEVTSSLPPAPPSSTCVFDQHFLERWLCPSAAIRQWGLVPGLGEIWEPYFHHFDPGGQKRQVYLWEFFINPTLVEGFLF